MWVRVKSAIRKSVRDIRRKRSSQRRHAELYVGPYRIKRTRKPYKTSPSTDPPAVKNSTCLIRKSDPTTQFRRTQQSTSALPSHHLPQRTRPVSAHRNCNRNGAHGAKSAMDRTKISKACEPCRRRKVKCNGEHPCPNCRSRPMECRYRLKSRIRARHSTPSNPPSATSSNPVDSRPEPGSERRIEPQDAPSELYGTVVAAAQQAPHQSTDGSQLFYGPSSNFAFLQQLHRIILSSQPGGLTSSSGGHDDQGLDLFLQRNVFFGVPSRLTQETHNLLTQNARLPDIAPRPLAEQFLDNFKVSSLHLLPFLTDASLDTLFALAYSEDAGSQPELQKAILLPLVLAIGALSTPETELAEALFMYAKWRSAMYEDAVTLPMIQISLLKADYQINIGRPNSGYLTVGTACRKALAMGLHANAEKTYPQTHVEDIEERRTTLWCLYFYET